MRKAFIELTTLPTKIKKARNSLYLLALNDLSFKFDKRSKGKFKRKVDTIREDEAIILYQYKFVS